jgi:hypothetical protein
MKKLILAFVGLFLFNSCEVPFKLESPNGIFRKSEDGSVFFGYKFEKPTVSDGK